jgi:hypothetical protein
MVLMMRSVIVVVQSAAQKYDQWMPRKGKRKTVGGNRPRTIPAVGSINHLDVAKDGLDIGLAQPGMSLSVFGR